MEGGREGGRGSEWGGESRDRGESELMKKLVFFTAISTTKKRLSQTWLYLNHMLHTHFSRRNSLCWYIHSFKVCDVVIYWRLYNLCETRAKFNSIGRSLSHCFKAVLQYVWSRLLRVIIIIIYLTAALPSIIYSLTKTSFARHECKCSFYQILRGVRHLCPTISYSGKMVAAVNCQLLLVMRQHICRSPAQLFCDWPVVLLQLQITVISCFQSQFGEI